MAFFSADEIARLAAKEVRVAPLVKFEFDGDTAYAWNGYTPLITGWQTWLPMFGAGSIDGLGFTGTGASENVTVSLNGLPDDALPFLANAINTTTQVSQRLMTVYMQFFDENWQPDAPPIGIFYGFMQPPSISRAPATDTEGSIQTISIVAENAFYFRSKPKNGRYTDADQKRRSPTDKGLEFTKSLTFKNFTYPDF